MTESLLRMGDFPLVDCELRGRCSGCSWIELPYRQQREQKMANIQSVLAQAGIAGPLASITYRAIQADGLRDRADLMIDQRSGQWNLGLFARDERVVLDMPSCPQLSPRLQEFLATFRRLRLEVARGSVRLRISPTGQRGIWLDLANVDVKRLLDERGQLEQLRAYAFVEIGQKRKALIERDGRLKLGDPHLQPWFETYLGIEELPTPLFTTVGGFTQPGFIANRVLLSEVRAILQDVHARRVAEFGSGSGNFTLPLAALSESVDAYEFEPLACAGLRMGAETAQLSERIQIRQGDWQRANRQQADFSRIDTILADPPRSGLGDFLAPLEQTFLAQRPPNFIYVSCYADSFARDGVRLARLGYRLKSTALVDQFPQSPHYEIVSHWSL